MCKHSIVLGNGTCYFCGEIAGPPCEGHGGCPGIGKPTSSRTMYEWDGTGEDPNRDLILCSLCAEEHNDIMDDQWKAYYDDKL
ncbi:MAG: hypothetical protein ACXAC5_03750 [Promethearchaeota archaeon]|jgi:hypothetical protein